jgi:uncharacterized low-complexity protein
MKSKTLTSLALSSTVAFSGIAFAAQVDNPFSATPLSSGYQVAQADKAKEASCGADKMADGTCGGMKTGAGKCGISMADANKDGKVSRAEADKHHAAMFNDMDANKDGFIDKDEMMKMKHGSCGADGKKSDGKCGEGKCGEGKCGTDMKKGGHAV